LGLTDDRILRRVGKDVESRRKSRRNVEVAIEENPIWSHGTMDVKGIVKQDRFGKFSNGFTYLFKYLIKTISIERFPELADLNKTRESDNKSHRYTHLGNKCFRTRGIVFSKAFKERIGLLKEKEPEIESEWERVKIIPKWEADWIEAQIRKVEFWPLGEGNG